MVMYVDELEKTNNRQDKMKKASIKLKYKFSCMKGNKKDFYPYVHDLIKLEVSYDLKRFFCLAGHTVKVLNFESPTLIESTVLCEHVADFSVSDDSNFLLIGGVAQSRSAALNFLSLDKYCYFDMRGEPRRGKVIWTSSPFRHSVEEHVKVINIGKSFDECGFVKFLPDREQFIATFLGNFGSSKLHKMNFNGEIISTIEASNVDMPRQRRNRIRKIDANNRNVFMAAENMLNIYDVDTFSLSKQIEFTENILAVNALNSNDFFVILSDGAILLMENGDKAEIARIEKEIVALGFDKFNFIFYFGNSKGGVFAIDKKGNVLIEDCVGKSIRDIVVVNSGKHILVGSKEMTFFLYENLSAKKNENNQEIIFKRGKNAKRKFSCHILIKTLI